MRALPRRSPASLSFPPMDYPKNSLEFWAQRASSASINEARFEVDTDFVGGPLVPMPLTSFDPFVNPSGGRNQFAVLKDITARCYLPICVDPETTVPNQTSDMIRALYHTYDFRVRINGQVIHYPVTFVRNADEYKSQLFNSRFSETVKSLDCEVFRQFVNPVFQGAGINVHLSLALEFYTFLQ